MGKRGMERIEHLNGISWINSGGFFKRSPKKFGRFSRPDFVPPSFIFFLYVWAVGFVQTSPKERKSAAHQSSHSAHPSFFSFVWQSRWVSNLIPEAEFDAHSRRLHRKRTSEGDRRQLSGVGNNLTGRQVPGGETWHEWTP